MLKDASIEYAHIYTNQRISDEQEISVQLLSEVSDELKRKGSSSSLVVMVDDYSFPDPSFDYSEFSDWLQVQGFKPDLLIRESQLIPYCDEVIGIIEDKKLKEEISDYVKSKKYPCSLFIATWYLLRLGKLESTILPQGLCTKQLINILPESYRPFEDKGLEIIAATPHKDCVRAIEYKFLPGRLIT